ncbi:MAG: gliding motility-associated C-terminal domain-containing protein [Saprospiraceae bacterium]|jgi:gliding motility-associated-like protein|nr:gliding motility-associated C-terminal domain-containing protein [Saprospiraceae bacterium]
MMKNWLVMAVLGCFASVLPGQRQLIFEFDNCSLSSSSGIALTTNSTPNCLCGIEGDAISISGQQITWPQIVDSFFKKDYSVCFSVRLSNPSGFLDLLSKSGRCNADTSLDFTYRSIDSVFIFTAREGFSKTVSLAAKADFNRCWQQICMTKTGGLWRLYLNNRLANQTTTNEEIRVDNGQPLRWNQSPCQSTVLSPSFGKIDKFLVADYGLNFDEVMDFYVDDQRIFTPDTLILKGDPIVLRAGNNCPGSAQWTPITDLDDPSSLTTTGTPQQTTTYSLRMVSSEGCVTSDTVLVRVVDPSAIECDKLLLPTAFTPNGDGLNETFGISNFYLVEKLEYFDIINKNGGIMASFSSATDQWNGYWKGKIAEPGNYFYRVSYQCQNKEYTRQGSFFLLR